MTYGPFYTPITIVKEFARALWPPRARYIIVPTIYSFITPSYTFLHQLRDVIEKISFNFFLFPHAIPHSSTLRSFFGRLWCGIETAYSIISDCDRMYERGLREMSEILTPVTQDSIILANFLFTTYRTGKIKILSGLHFLLIRARVNKQINHEISTTRVTSLRHPQNLTKTRPSNHNNTLFFFRNETTSR